MKRTLLTCFVAFMLSLYASAYDFMVDNIAYNIISGENGMAVEVTYYVENDLNGTYPNMTSADIPETVTNSEGQTYQVTSIGEKAFYNCTGLTDVTIPNSVSKIGNYAFNSCTGLTDVTIPNSVISIGDFAFSACSDIKTITFGNSLTSIGINAFSSCRALTGIIIPNSVTSIGYGAFSMCSELTDITLGNSLTSIEAYMFDNCRGLTSIIIPNSVTSIGDYAFEYCSNLTDITIPNSIVYVGANPFIGTIWYNNQPDGLIYIGKAANKYKGNMPSDTSISLKSGTTCISDNCFNNCSGLSNIDIVNTVTYIGSAFAGCTNLNNISLPGSLTTIDDYAFINCNNLKNITIPKSVTKIGEGVFARTNLISINVESGNSVYDSRDNCNAIIETATNTLISGCFNTQIPSTVTAIGDYAFYGCNKLAGITIPNSVTNIGNWAFASCSLLSDMTIPKTVISIGDSPFIDDKGLKSLKVENGNPKYDSRDNCNAIIETATNTLISGCYKTKIPATVTVIGDKAFYKCPQLAIIRIPESVKSINKYAFAYCSNLMSVTIPNSLTNLESDAFTYCTGLTSIKSYIENPAIVTYPHSVKNIFNKVDKVACKLLVPRGTVDKYRAVSPWSAFSIIEEFEDKSGDINSDGSVNTGDVSMLYSVIMGGDSINNCDLNKDGSVNSGDVSTLYNLILGQ